MTERVQSRPPALAILVALTVLVAAPAQAQTFTILHSFTGGVDGNGAYSGVNLIAGSLYGTTGDGGSYGNGNVYRLNHRGSGWTLSTLYSFKAVDDGNGWDPVARVTAGP